MSDESEHAIEQDEALTMSMFLSKGGLEDARRIRLLEEWMRETIRAWKTGDIKTAHIQRGQSLLEG